MLEITGDQVWEALRNEVVVSELILRPFVMALPELLADLLDKPVTVETLVRARAVHIRHSLEGEYIRKDAAADFGEPLDADDEIFVETMEEEWRKALSSLEAIATNVSAFLEEGGRTEDNVVLHYLSPENAERYLAGELTIAGLLISQPTIIVCMI